MSFLGYAAGGLAGGSYLGSQRRKQKKQRRMMKGQEAEYALLQQEAFAEEQKLQLQTLIDKDRIGEKLRRSNRRRAGSGFLGGSALDTQNTLG